MSRIATRFLALETEVMTNNTEQKGKQLSEAGDSQYEVMSMSMRC